MKNKYIHIIVIACLLPIVVHAMESSPTSSWQTINVQPSVIPCNITPLNDDTVYLLGKKNEKHAASIFKLVKNANENIWEQQPALNIQSNFSSWLSSNKTSIEYIHAIQNRLFAIVKEHYDASITYKIMHKNLQEKTWLSSSWQQIYPPDNEKEYRQLFRLSGKTLNQMWVAYKADNTNESFSLKVKVDGKTFIKEHDMQPYQSVDTNAFSPDVTRWALLSTDNQLISKRNLDSKKPKTWNLNAQLLPKNIFVHNESNIYGIDRENFLYKWDGNLKNFMVLDNSIKIKSLCIINEQLYSVDTKGQLHIWVQETNDQRKKRLETNKKIFDIITDQSLNELDYITANSTSSSSTSACDLIESEEKILEKEVPQLEQSTQQLEDSKHSLEKQRKSRQEIKKELKKPTLKTNKQSTRLNLSPSKHFLNYYIEKAKKQIPEKPQEIFPENSKLRKGAIALLGLTTAASAVAYIKGYTSFNNILPYIFTTGATLAGSLAARDAGFEIYNQRKLKKWENNAKWHEDLLKLKKITNPVANSIALQSYAIAQGFENPKNIYNDKNNYHFYLMPTDEHLVSTFEQVVDEYKDQKSNINYIAVRPIPGVPEECSLFGTVFPRIIVATNIDDLIKAPAILTSLKKLTKKIPSIGKQPSFSQKTLDNKLIYWSKGSFASHKDVYDNSSWWQRLTKKSPQPIPLDYE